MTKWATLKRYDNLKGSELPTDIPIWHEGTDVDEPTGCGDDMGRWRWANEQSLPKHIFWQEEKDMKLAGNPFKVTPLIEGGNTIKELMDNVRHDAYEQAQLSLLQQIVDDLKVKGKEIEELPLLADTITIKSYRKGYLNRNNELIAEYEAIIEGSK